MVIKVIGFPVLVSLCYRKRLETLGVISFINREFEVALLRKIHE